MKKKSTTKKNPKEKMLLVLDGKVYLEQYKGNKLVEQDEIEGKLVLKALLHCIEQGVRKLEYAQD